MNNNQEFMLVHKSILPDFFPSIIKAREMIEGEKKSVSETCKELKISRSTYYKYKDYVFYPTNSNNPRANLSFIVEDVSGVLNSILSVFTTYKCNVISINQSNPINNLANIVISLDTANINGEFDNLIKILKSLPNVRNVEVIAHE